MFVKHLLSVLNVGKVVESRKPGFLELCTGMRLCSILMELLMLRGDRDETDLLQEEQKQEKALRFHKRMARLWCCCP